MPVSVPALPGSSRRWLLLPLLAGFYLGPAALLLAGQQPGKAGHARAMDASDTATLQAAVRTYEGGDAQAAEPVLRALLQRYPHDAETLETLGLIYAEQSQLQKAIPLLEGACVARPGSPTVFENLGIAYLKLNRNSDALRVFEKAGALEPDGRREAMIGTALMGLKRFGEAARAFRVASQADSADRDSRYQWALALSLSGDGKQAESRLESVSPADRSAQEQALLGDLHEREGRFADAVSDYRSAVRIDPAEDNVNGLGSLLLIHAAYDAALSAYSSGLSRYPSSSRMMFGLALSRYGDNDFTGAAELFTKLHRLEPHNQVYVKMLARSCSLTLSDPGTACDAMIVYAQGHPEDVSAQTAAAATLMQRRSGQQDLKLVHTFLQRAMGVDAQSVEANYLMGVWFQQQSLWQQSLPFLRKAVQIDPGYGRAHYRLARTLFRLGDRSAADDEIRRNAECNREEERKAGREIATLQPMLAAMR